jgi:hypothetical protein
MTPKRRDRDSPTKEYFSTLIRTHGRKLLYWDTGAILGCFEQGGGRFLDLLNQSVGDRLATSSYVVAETVRWIVKSKPSTKFHGPQGERGPELVRHLLMQWLTEKGIEVLYPEPSVFNAARDLYVTQYHAFGCDLCDTLSFVIVKGLEQQRIVSPDGHFRSMGLLCLPE